MINYVIIFNNSDGSMFVARTHPVAQELKRALVASNPTLYSCSTHDLTMHTLTDRGVVSTYANNRLGLTFMDTTTAQ